MLGLSRYPRTLNHPLLLDCTQRLGADSLTPHTPVDSGVLFKVLASLAGLSPKSLTSEADRHGAMRLGVQVLYVLNRERPGCTHHVWERLSTLLGDNSLGWGTANVATLRWWFALWPAFKEVPAVASLLRRHGWTWLERYHDVRHQVVGSDQPLARALVDAVWSLQRVSMERMRQLPPRSMAAEQLCACWLTCREGGVCPPAGHWVHGWLPEQSRSLETVVPRLLDALAHHPAMFQTAPEDVGFTCVELEPIYRLLHGVCQHRWGLDIADEHPWAQAVENALVWIETCLPHDVPGELVFTRCQQLGRWLVAAARERWQGGVHAVQAGHEDALPALSDEVFRVLQVGVGKEWALPTTPDAWGDRWHQAPPQLLGAMRRALCEVVEDTPPLLALQRRLFPQPQAGRWAQAKLALLGGGSGLSRSALTRTQRFLFRQGVEDVPRALWEGYGHWLAHHTTEAVDDLQASVETGWVWLMDEVPEPSAVAALMSTQHDADVLLKLWWVAQCYARDPQASEHAKRCCVQLMRDVMVRNPQAVLESCLPLGCQHQPIPAWLTRQRIEREVGELASSAQVSRAEHRSLAVEAVRSLTSLPERVKGHALVCLGLRAQHPWARWERGAWLVVGLGVAVLTGLSWTQASQVWPLGGWCAVVLVTVSSVLVCCVLGLRQRAAKIQAQRWVDAQAALPWEAQLPSAPLPPASSAIERPRQGETSSPVRASR